MLSPFFKRKDDNLFYIKNLEKECLNKVDSIPIPSPNKNSHPEDSGWLPQSFSKKIIL